MIIFDLGSGNTCQNSIEKACQMVLELANCKIKTAIIKWQLFEKAGDNIPLKKEVFERAYKYATALGIPTTASVFDKNSLDYLLTFGIPFVKIANSQDSKNMLKYIPDDMPAIVSTDDPDFKTQRKITDIIYTVSKYPAKKSDYEKFGKKLTRGISDHTENFDLFWQYQPMIYECHFKLEDSTGLDAGKFARTPAQIKKLNDWVKNVPSAEIEEEFYI